MEEDKLKSIAQDAIAARRARESTSLGKSPTANGPVVGEEPIVEESIEELIHPSRVEMLKLIRNTRNPATYEEYQRELNEKLSFLEKLADELTGGDERLNLIAKILIEQSQLMAQGIMVQLPEEIIFPNLPHYNVLTLPLDTARTEPGEEMDMPGDTITAFTDGTLVGCFLRMDDPTHDAIPLNEFNPYHYRARFQKFWLETTAQAGKYLRLHIGREAGAEAAVQITAVAPKTIFYSVRSDKDSHFTTTLAQYEKEDENLGGLLLDKIRISGISIQADQNLLFKVLVWARDTFDNTDLDVDTFIGEIELDLTTNGFRIGGAGQYYYDLRGLDLEYEDKDATKELHVSLYNQSPGAKSAGALGEVVVEVYYELMG